MFGFCGEIFLAKMYQTLSDSKHNFWAKTVNLFDAAGFPKRKNTYIRLQDSVNNHRN